MNLVPILKQHLERLLQLTKDLSDADAETVVSLFGHYHPGVWEGGDPRGPWFTSARGRRVYILDPTPEELDPDDMAHALSRIARYGGHCGAVATTDAPGFSQLAAHVGGPALLVAQHSLLVAYLVEAKFRQEHGRDADILVTGEYIGSIRHLVCKAIVHDGTEAWLGDVIGPMKRLFPFYKTVERNFEEALFKRLGLGSMTDNERRIIKYADRLALVIERALYCAHPPPLEDILEEERIALPDYAERVIEYVQWREPAGVVRRVGTLHARPHSCWSYDTAQTLFGLALEQCPGVETKRDPKDFGNAAGPGWQGWFGGFPS